MTFAVWPIGQHRAVCHTITHHRRAGGLCPVKSRGHCSLCSQDPLHSQGEQEDQEEPHSQMESPQIIPEMGWKPRKRGETRTHLTGCWQLCSKNSDSARGTELYKCQGHLTLNSARGTEHFRCHGHIGQLLQPETVFGSGQVRWIFCIFCCSPHSKLELGLIYLFLVLSFKTTSLTFNIISSYLGTW